MSVPHALDPTPEPARVPRLAVVATPAVPSPRAVALCRRFALAVYDLGLVSVTGPRWAVPVEDGIGFATLSLSAADRLVRRLEDLANPAPALHGGPASGAPGDDGQLSLF